MTVTPGEPPGLRNRLERQAAARRAGPVPARARARGGLRSLSLVLGAAGLAGGTLMLSRGGTEAALTCYATAMVLLAGGFRRNRSESS